MKTIPYRRLLGGPSAFSLTEVVIAMGVAAVAFTSLMALFPLGLAISRESYEDTQAALLARTILQDLSDVQGGNTNARGPVGRLVQVGTNSDAANDKSMTNFKNIRSGSGDPNATVFIAYTNALIGNAYGNPYMFRPSMEITGAQFTNGLPGAIAVARVAISHLISPADTLWRTEIALDLPGDKKETNRIRQSFVGSFK